VSPSAFRAAIVLVAASTAAWPATKILVTVVEQRSGRPIVDLKAEEFRVLDDRTPRRVTAVEYSSQPIDVMLLVDSSLVGAAVQPVAADLIAKLAGKEQMALVAFDSSADLLQDFTASQDVLRQALGRVRYGNTPRILDAVYAAADGGFQASTFRRVMVLLTTGLEGPSRIGERDVVRLARKNGISIYPVYMVGSERSLLEALARQTGGATFNLRDLSRQGKAGSPGEAIFPVLRAHYTLTLDTNLALGDKVKVEVLRTQKMFASALPLD